MNVGKQLEKLEKEQSSVLEETRGIDYEKGKWGPMATASPILTSVCGLHSTGLVLTALQQVEEVGVITQLVPGP